jgi:hypothetical protein
MTSPLQHPEDADRTSDAWTLRGDAQPAPEASFGSWELDATTGHVVFDARALALLRLAAEQARQRVLEDLLDAVDEADRDDLRAAVAATVADREPRMLECRAAAADEQGGARWLVVALLGHDGPSAVAPKLVGVVYDVSEKRRAEERRGRVARELSAMDEMAAPNPSTAVTAHVFGEVPLHERAPRAHAEIAAQYATILRETVRRRAYRGDAHDASLELRALARRLGELGAGAREATEIHARALREVVRGAPIAHAHALVEEGRLTALELMGHLVSYYRRRSVGAPPHEARRSDDAAPRAERRQR